MRFVIEIGSSDRKKSYARYHFTGNMQNPPKVRSINFTEKDHSCNILLYSFSVIFELHLYSLRKSCLWVM